MSLNYYRNFDLTSNKFLFIARSHKLGITSPRKGKRWVSKNIVAGFKLALKGLGLSKIEASFLCLDWFYKMILVATNIVEWVNACNTMCTHLNKWSVFKAVLNSNILFQQINKLTSLPWKDLFTWLNFSN